MVTLGAIIILLLVNLEGQVWRVMDKLTQWGETVTVLYFCTSLFVRAEPTIEDKYRVLSPWKWSIVLF